MSAISVNGVPKHWRISEKANPVARKTVAKRQPEGLAKLCSKGRLTYGGITLSGKQEESGEVHVPCLRKLKLAFK